MITYQGLIVLREGMAGWKEAKRAETVDTQMLVSLGTS